MGNIPTWIWYVGGAVLFLFIYLYITSSKNQSANPIGQTVNVPSLNELGNYNGSADILSAVLGMQGQEIQHLAASQPPTQSK